MIGVLDEPQEGPIGAIADGKKRARVARSTAPVEFVLETSAGSTIVPAHNGSPVTSPSDTPISKRHLGIAMVASSAVLWSTAGLFVRMADLDAWTMIGWRSIFSALFLFGLLLVRSGRHSFAALRSMGRQGFVSIPISIVSTITYVFALKLTSVANVMTIYATLPFVATGIAFVWLGERVGPRVLIASAIALVGIVIMAGSVTDPRDVAGNLMAFLMTFGFGLQLVHTKRYPDLDMTLVMALAAALCALLCWPLMGTMLPNPGQLVVLALFGFLTTGLAYVLVLNGGRYITSGETGFISMVDVVLGPLWVWLFFAEQPARSVLIGGALVLASVLWYLGKGLRATALRPIAR